MVAAVAAADSPPRPEPAPRPPRYDLTPTTPDVTLFPPRADGCRAQHALAPAAAPALDYGEPLGERALREALADHLGRTRGVIADPARIVVVQGTARAIDLLLGSSVAAARTGRHRGPLATTASTSASARSGSSSSRSRSTGTGMRVDALDADAVLVTPRTSSRPAR